MTHFMTEVELKGALPQWVAAVYEFGRNARSIRPHYSALIVVDMQREFLVEDGGMPLWGGPAIIPRLGALICTFRERERPVLYTQHCYRNPETDGGATAEFQRLNKSSMLLREGAPNTEVHPDIRPRPDDYVIKKQRYSGFFSTPLESILRGFDVKDVVIGGVASNCCCAATAHDAFFRDFHVFFLADGTGASDEQAHISTLRDIAWTYGTVLTVEQVREQITLGVNR